MTVEELQASFDEAMNNFKLISKLNNKQLSPSEDDYLNLNRAYFRICTDFYETFLHLIGEGKPFPAIVILRSILEIYTKAIYLDVIEKPKGTDVKPLISGEKDFPSFFKMTSALDKFGEEGKNGLEGMFMQFTKQDLAQYEKFSLFTHGRGEFVKTFMSVDNAQLCIEGVSDLIVTAKGIYETLSLHYFRLQKLTSELQRLAHELQKPTMYKNS